MSTLRDCPALRSCGSPGDTFERRIENCPFRRDESIPGLSVMDKEDGCWLRFQTKRGMEAMINLNLIWSDRGGIVGKAIRQWIKERGQR